MSKNNHKNFEIKLDNLNLSKKSLETILEHVRVAKNRLNSIENIIMEAQKSQHSPSRDIPGEVGIFDGEYLVTKEGIKYEVPKNYSAKSLLIVGDELKKYQEDGKDMFKIVSKIARKKVQGTLSKKDGKYFVLLDNNKSYQLQKSAVEFRNLKHGDRVIVVIPEVENGSDYAAIDKLATSTVKNTSQQVKEESKVELKEVKREEPKEEIKSVRFDDEDLL